MEQDRYELLTVNEGMEKLRISRATLYRYIREGELGYVQIGGRKFIAEKDITEFIERNRVPAMNAAPPRG